MVIKNQNPTRLPTYNKHGDNKAKREASWGYFFAKILNDN